MLWLPATALCMLEALLHAWMFTPVRSKITGKVIRMNRRWPKAWFYGFWNGMRLVVMAVLIVIADEHRVVIIIGELLLLFMIHELVFTSTLNLSRGLPLNYLGRVSTTNSGYDSFLWLQAGNWAFYLKMLIAIAIGAIGYICLRWT